MQTTSITNYSTENRVTLPELPEKTPRMPEESLLDNESFYNKLSEKESENLIINENTYIGASVNIVI